MNWKKNYRSFYYKHAEDPEDILLTKKETAHLIIDVQKTYLLPNVGTQTICFLEPNTSPNICSN